MKLPAKDRKIRIRIPLPSLFLFLGSGSALLWLLDIFRRGTDSRQAELFFLKFGDFLADFVNVIGYAAYGDPYNCTAYTGLGEKGYPPLTYVLLRPFAGLVDIDRYYEQNYFLNMYQEPLLLIMWLLSTALLLLALFMLIHRCVQGGALKKGLTAALFLLCRPVLFTVERGNIILLAAVCTAYFLFHYDDSSRVRKETALIALGIAFALKLSPAVLGFLLLVNRQFREAVRAALYGLFFLLTPFLLLKGGFSNIPLFLRNMRMLIANYTGGSSFSSSAFDAAQLAELTVSCGKYLICALLLLFCFFYRRKWEKALAVTMVLLLAPSFSGYYCLLYLIPAAVLFLNETEFRVIDWLTGAAFFLLFALFRTGLSTAVRYTAWQWVLAGLMLLYGVFAVMQTVMERRAGADKDKLDSDTLYRFVTGRLRFKLPSVSPAVRRRIIVISGAVLVPAALGVRLYPTVRDGLRYRRGAAQLADASYREALDTFTALGHYRDSAEQAEACRRQLTDEAIRAESDGAYDKAAELYRIAPDYAENRSRLAALLDENPDLICVNDQIWFSNRLWIVLEQTDTDYLLMSADSVGTHKFYEDPSQIVIDWDEPDAMDTALANSTHPALTWETSSVRRWLNEEWLQELPAEDTARIILCSIHTPANPTYGTDCGNDTEDTVFLLSAQEFSEYAKTCTFNTNYHASLLRSTGKKDGTVAFFMDNDLLDMGGFNDVVEGEIRPVIRVSKQ